MPRTMNACFSKQGKIANKTVLCGNCVKDENYRTRAITAAPDNVGLNLLVCPKNKPLRCIVCGYKTPNDSVRLAIEKAETIRHRHYDPANFDAGAFANELLIDLRHFCTEHDVMFAEMVEKSSRYEHADITEG